MKKMTQQAYRLKQLSLLGAWLVATPGLTFANSVPVINQDQHVEMVALEALPSAVTLPSTNLPAWIQPVMPAEPAPTVPVAPVNPPPAFPNMPVAPPAPVTPTPPPMTPPDVPTTTEPVERFVGLPLGAETHPETTITGVTLANGGFIIHASSPISQVTHFVLAYDRLVIDIHNAVPGTPNGHGHSHDHGEAMPLPAGVRKAAQEGFTRVVFDMDPVPNYNLQLNTTRDQLQVSFVPTVIHEISLSSSTYHDYITFHGDGIAAFNLDLVHAQHLMLELPLVSFVDNLLINDAGTFHFIDGFNMTAVEGLTASFALTTRGMVSYSYFAGENSLTLRLGAPTFRHIDFDPEVSVISLLNSEELQLTVEQLTMVNNYLGFEHVFSFAGDLSAHFGYGDIPFTSSHTEHVRLQTTPEGQTEVVVSSNHITYAELIQTPEGIDIRIFSPREVYDFIVMLDPGHGGSDAGAVHFGYRESDLALTIGNTVYAWLQQHPHIGVFTTRHDDTFVTLADRATLANGVAADLFVSIHLNGFHTGVPNGSETYWTPHVDEDRWPLSREAVAYVFHNNVLADLGRADRGVRTANFAVLRLTNMPSVLLEYGFMSNEAELRAMTSPEGMQAMKRATYRSILEIYELTRQPQ